MRWKEIIETRFADFDPEPGEWVNIPRFILINSAGDPPPNINTELFDLIKKTYADIGGHHKVPSYQTIPGKYSVWTAVELDDDDIPDAVKFGKKTPHGTKWTGTATDGTVEAKQLMLDTTADLLQTPGNYSEQSKAIAHIMITRYHVPSVNDPVQVKHILNEPIEWIGKHPEGKYPGYDGWYTRDIAGHREMKILLGTPVPHQPK